ncbi:unnamed protein product [Moneuplotes crassus]|uniref:Uncharacterized protein n=1 Tax=Euplotes crassus TaxID=5936 RepID=A0AAD1U5V2_EUPCR|nr:unnamed protein product [Moneuplotes crassus]
MYRDFMGNSNVNCKECLLKSVDSFDLKSSRGEAREFLREIEYQSGFGQDTVVIRKVEENAEKDAFIITAQKAKQNGTAIQKGAGIQTEKKVVNKKLQKIENKDDIVIDDSEREIDGAQFEIHVENLDSIKNSSDARCEKNSKRLNRNVVIEEEIKCAQISDSDSVSNSEDSDELNDQVEDVINNNKNLFGSVYNGIIKVQFSPMNCKRLKELNQTEEAPAVIAPHNFGKGQLQVSFMTKKKEQQKVKNVLKTLQSLL